MSSVLGSDETAARPAGTDAIGTRTALARLAARLGGPGRAGAQRRGRSRTGMLLASGALVILGLLPLAGLSIPWILPGPVDVLNSAGTLEVLGLCFVFSGVALGFDLLFGFTGLLSFGQVLYFATGVYVLNAALSVWHWALLPAAALTLAVGGILAVLLGSISLKARGIAFAMVTLAFAQAGYYLIEDNPHALTGGDTGLVMSTGRLPSMLIGVASTRNLYWLALIFLVAAYGITWLATESVTGQVFLAIRESERRAEVLGLRPFPFKLASFVISSLIATSGGMVYLILVGTAAPDAVASTTVTVSILIMVMLGGVGTRWGAVGGAMLYVYLHQYLLKVAAEPSFATLPAPLRVPLSQPDFLLGAIFIAFILFAPDGIAGLARKRRPAQS
jgi:branched-chain amino acid transport system permease protein